MFHDVPLQTLQKHRRNMFSPNIFIFFSSFFSADVPPLHGVGFGRMAGHATSVKGPPTRCALSRSLQMELCKTPINGRK